MNKSLGAKTWMESQARREKSSSEDF